MPYTPKDEVIGFYLFGTIFPDTSGPPHGQRSQESLRPNFTGIWFIPFPHSLPFLGLTCSQHPTLPYPTLSCGLMVQSGSSTA